MKGPRHESHRHFRSGISKKSTIEDPARVIRAARLSKEALEQKIELGLDWSLYMQGVRSLLSIVNQSGEKITMLVTLYAK